MVTTVAKDCRIVVWEGTSLWAFDASGAAPAPQSTRFHAHHAIQLTIAAGGHYTLQTETSSLPGPLVLVAPDVPHAFLPKGRHALIFVEPESRTGAALLHEINGRSMTAVDPNRLPGVAERLAAIWDTPRPPDARVAELGQDILAQLLGPAASPSPIDPRIARAIAWAEDRLDKAVTMPEAASVACLSESRFSHLFTEETGLPFRSWVLWRRMMRAVQARGAGASLTDAAHQAGFSDSAHFSRTFLRMFGVQAASLAMV